MATMSIMVEHGMAFYQCDDCDHTFFTCDDEFYGHDCEQCWIYQF